MLPFLGLMFMDACLGVLVPVPPGVQQGADCGSGEMCQRLAGNPIPIPSLLDLGQLLCCSGQQGL